MERRSFFGILGTMGAFLGLKKASSASIDLPVIHFGQNGRISNVEEIFLKSSRYLPKRPNLPWIQIGKAWLQQADINLIRQADPKDQRYYGPVWIIRIDHVSLYSMYPCPESIFVEPGLRRPISNLGNASSTDQPLTEAGVVQAERIDKDWFLER